MQQSARALPPLDFDGLRPPSPFMTEVHARWCARVRDFVTREIEPNLADWEARTTTDVLAVRADLLAQGFASHLFALPYGDYGQNGTDSDIPRLLSELLTRQFGTFFTQPGRPGYSRPGAGEAPRFELHTDTGLAALYSWLRWSAPANDLKD